ncbi:Polyvinylalcohol dehydrogenase [BD1-7 clade bacterium]|uniref:Polyvinylalcohol dehydrogenase n=1 Tax=BD1-7 clade bacterium TaxID=2029982 RepID=A0A5S9PYM8_9GAMM|nr:Polyvinylalcohol dehydrogenase [BD1-7 clade bacterium]
MTIKITGRRAGLLTLTIASLLSLTACFPKIPSFAACPVTRGGDLALHVPGASGGDLAWASWGGDLANTHHAASETLISPANVEDLEVKWISRVSGSVSATPTVTEGTLYITDWGTGASIDANAKGGKVFAIDANDGSQLWSQSVRRLNNDSLNNVSRSSPAIFEDLVIIADVQNPAPITVFPSLIDRARRFLFGFDDLCGGYVYALHRVSGDLVWSRKIGTKLYDQISQSPVVYNDKVLVGVSSHESTYARSEKIPCCTFRGSFVALDAHTGEIEWRTYMIDDEDDRDQFSGAAVWGGAPTIDVARNRVYVPTGNNYWVPQSVQQCLVAAVGDEAATQACLAVVSRNFVDSIVALDIDTGAVKWSTSSQTYDAWTTACDFETLFPLLAFSSSSKNCPNPKGPDSDFAQPPVLVTIDVGAGVMEDRLFAGNKAGEYFALNPDTGAIIWRKHIGPAGLIGGMQFGSASDGQRVYLQNTNFDHRPYTLEAGSLAGTTIRSGFWTALDPVTGDILWQTPVPNYDAPIRGGGTVVTGGGEIGPDGASAGGQTVYTSGMVHPVWGIGLGEGFFNWPMGGLTVANGVVFAGVADLQGTMVAMDASTGTIRWMFQTGQSIVSTPSVVDGRVYWGSGYKTGTDGDRVYSFGLP